MFEQRMYQYQRPSETNMWFFLFFSISCSDSPLQQVLTDTSSNLQVEKLEKVTIETQDVQTKKIQNSNSTETLVETSILIQELGSALKSRSDTKKMEVVQPFLNKKIYSGSICGQMVKVIEERLDIKGERQEKRKKQLERIKRQRDTKKKRLSISQQKSLQERADKAFEDFETAVENDNVSPQEESLLAEHTIVHQALPKQPCAIQLQTLHWVQVSTDSQQYSVEHTDAIYKCVDGEFTEKIEKIEVRGEEDASLEDFSKMREDCLQKK